jgi:hypothetical protein
VGGGGFKMRIGEKYGMGAIGIFMIMLLTAFFWTMFYIFMNSIYTGVLPHFTSDTDTLAYYTSTLSFIWFPIIPFLFAIALCLWAIIQSQTPMASFVIAIVWIVIATGWFSYTAMFMVLDPWLMKTLPTILPVDPTWGTAYNNFIPPLWRGFTWMIAFTLAIFGTYLAPSYIERGGKTYDFASGY